MGALARLAQVVQGTARHHLAPVAHEGFDDLLDVENARLATVERHHVDAEHALQRGVLVEVIENDIRHFTALQLDDHAHAGLVDSSRSSLMPSILPSRTKSAIFSSSRALFTWYGSSVTMIDWRLLRFSSTSM